MRLFAAQGTRASLHRPLAAILISLAVLQLGACGGGAETQSLPNISKVSGTATSNYSGPAPLNTDVQNFRVAVWENLRQRNRCGQCHNESGQVPQFARGDNVNLAYDTVTNFRTNTGLPLVDFNNLRNSRLVTKVAEGHNCWLSTNSSCGDVMLAYLQNWTGQTISNTERVVNFVPPTNPSRIPGTTLRFPPTTSLPGTFDPVYKYLTGVTDPAVRCVDCHRSTTTAKQSPFFANADIASAYEAAQQKIDLTNPNNSRFVRKLDDEGHNCWDLSEVTDPLNPAKMIKQCALDMRTVIQTYANTLSVSAIDPSWVTSMAMYIPDGILQEAGARYEANVIAQWKFKEAAGATVAADTSGIEPAINLTVSDTGATFVGNGINLTGGNVHTTSSATKLYDRITQTGEYTIEAWITPADKAHRAPIVSYAAGATLRNAALTQYDADYRGYNRAAAADGSNVTGADGAPFAVAAAKVANARQHVAMTFDPVNGRRIYVNGELASKDDTANLGSLASWDNRFPLTLGSEAAGNNPWQGIIHMVAIHNRALTADQVKHNAGTDIDPRYFVLFNIDAHTGLKDSYIVLQAMDYDQYSYLFYNPTFIVLDPKYTATTPISIEGLRIGINGRLVEVGQAFKNLKATVDTTNYSASGQSLSTVGTIIPKDTDKEHDEFFLVFDKLGTDTTTPAITDTIPAVAVPATSTAVVPAVGLRTFEKINASLSAMTGVSMTNGTVNATYLLVKQQMPSVDNLGGFVSAQQLGVTQLAIEYCNALVNNSSLRDSVFGTFNYSATPVATFGTKATPIATTRGQIINPLLNRTVHADTTALDHMPLPTTAYAELDSLISTLITNGTADTPTIVKGVCAAAIGNAAMLVH